MTWTTFLIAIASVYGIYYGLTLLFDVLRSPGNRNPDEGYEELVFTEDVAPEVVSLPAPHRLRPIRPVPEDVPDALQGEGPPDDFPNAGMELPEFGLPETPDESLALQQPGQPEPVAGLQSTGGVSIRDLFRLAKQDLIEFTREIPYG